MSRGLEPVGSRSPISTSISRGVNRRINGYDPRSCQPQAFRQVHRAVHHGTRSAAVDFLIDLLVSFHYALEVSLGVFFFIRNGEHVHHHASIFVLQDVAVDHVNPIEFAGPVADGDGSAGGQDDGVLPSIEARIVWIRLPYIDFLSRLLTIGGRCRVLDDVDDPKWADMDVEGMGLVGCVGNDPLFFRVGAQRPWCLAVGSASTVTFYLAQVIAETFHVMMTT